MKKTVISLTAVFVAALLYVSCSNDDSKETITTSYSTVGASVAIDAATEMDVNTGLSVTTSNPAAKSAETPVSTCYTITVSGTTYPKTFTVDFGTTGCKDGDLTRKGKLEITLTGPLTTTGSKMTIKRIDYSIGNLKLEGTIEYTNTTTVATVPQWTRKVTGGKLTDSQGRVYTNSGSHTTKQTAGVDTPYVLSDNVYEVPEGSNTVTASDGTVLTLTVQETLIKKYACLFISKGKLKIQGGLLNGVVDYGNNDCDAKYTYTHENGSSVELSL